MNLASYPSDPAMQSSVAHPDSTPQRRGIFAGFSNIERNGPWTPPPSFRALAVFGNIELDLTEAELGAHTDIEMRCFFGSIKVTVPPGVRLECDGDATIGSYEVTRKASGPLPPDASFVRIRAAAFLGSIEIVVLDPKAPTLLQRIKARWKLRDTDPN